MKDNNMSSKIFVIIIAIIILSIFTIKLNNSFNNKVKADSANEVSILNNLDVSSFDYYASYISLDDNNLKVRVKNKMISEDKLEIFDLTNSNIFTMSNKVEYDKDNKPESLYVVYEKVKLKDLDKYLKRDIGLRIWSDDNICSNLIIELD